jgi:hypothetical protein
LQRDPAAFREFVRSTYFSKDQEDPFSHFYIKEAGKIERIYNTKKTLESKINDMLLENQLENEDNLSLSHQLKTEVKINYDLKSLMKSEFVYDVDPELNDSDISDKIFLA